MTNSQHSSVNGQSSFTVMTDRFVEPNKDNFDSLIIKNGSQVSDKIKEMIETTKGWLKTDTVTDNHELQIQASEEEQPEIAESILPF